MELARQQDDRKSRQERDRDEAADAAFAREHLRDFRVFQRLGEQRHRPIEHDIGHEHADGEEGDQLDDRFRRDREDEPVLVLGRVDVPGAEQHGEGGHRQRDEQGDVAGHGRHEPGACPDLRQDGAERGGHRFELEGEVGDRSRNRDHRDGRRDRLVLAVTGRDEVGDRGDVLALGEPHHADDQRRGKPDHQDRPEIDGEEVEAGTRGEADRAEEGPGRAVDRERERVNQT